MENSYSRPPSADEEKPTDPRHGKHSSVCEQLPSCSMVDRQRQQSRYVATATARSEIDLNIPYIETPSDVQANDVSSISILSSAAAQNVVANAGEHYSAAEARQSRKRRRNIEAKKYTDQSPESSERQVQGVLQDHIARSSLQSISSNLQWDLNRPSNQLFAQLSASQQLSVPTTHFPASQLALPPTLRSNCAPHHQHLVNVAEGSLQPMATYQQNPFNCVAQYRSQRAPQSAQFLNHPANHLARSPKERKIEAAALANQFANQLPYQQYSHLLANKNLAAEHIDRTDINMNRNPSAAVTTSGIHNLASPLGLQPLGIYRSPAGHSTDRYATPVCATPVIHGPIDRSTAENIYQAHLQEARREQSLLEFLLRPTSPLMMLPVNQLPGVSSTETYNQAEQQFTGINSTTDSGFNINPYTIDVADRSFASRRPQLGFQPWSYSQLHNRSDQPPPVTPTDIQPPVASFNCPPGLQPRSTHFASRGPQLGFQPWNNRGVQPARVTQTGIQPRSTHIAQRPVRSRSSDNPSRDLSAHPFTELPRHVQNSPTGTRPTIEPTFSTIGHMEGAHANRGTDMALANTSSSSSPGTTFPMSSNIPDFFSFAGKEI